MQTAPNPTIDTYPTGGILVGPRFLSCVDGFLGADRSLPVGMGRTAEDAKADLLDKLACFRDMISNVLTDNGRK